MRLKHESQLLEIADLRQVALAEDRALMRVVLELK